jgi:hypothetical protein
MPERGFEVGEVKAEDLKMIITEKSLRDMIPEHDTIPEFDPLPVKCFREWGEAGLVQMTHPQDVTAVYLHSAPSSVSHEVKCNGCKKAKKPYFEECRTNKAVQGGACSNCVMKHHAAYCSWSRCILRTFGSVLTVFRYHYTRECCCSAAKAGHPKGQTRALTTDKIHDSICLSDSESITDLE